MFRTRYEIWKSKFDGKWYFTLYSNNNEAIADATQGYDDRRTCEKCIRSVRFNAPIAPIKIR